MRNLTPDWTERNANPDRAVLIGGEEFTYRTGVTPEEILALQDPDQTVKPEEIWPYLDQMIMLVIDAKDHQRWQELRARKDNPLTGLDIRAVYDGLLEVALGRPPTKDANSSSLPPEPGTNSTGDSSPELEEVLKN